MTDAQVSAERDSHEGGGRSDAGGVGVGDQQRAERAFSKSIVISGIRCTLTYVLIPFVFPLVGWGAGVGPWIGLPIGVAAIVANAVSVRRLHRADHRMKWPMTALSGGITVLLVILVVVDLGEILG